MAPARSSGHRICLGKKVVGKTATRVSAKCAMRVGTISRKTSDSTDKLNGQNPLDIAIPNALGLLRGQSFEN
jgi:hypothetical protein